VCVLELNDPSHCNAIDWAMANDLQRAIERLKEMAQVRIGRLWMGGGWPVWLVRVFTRFCPKASFCPVCDRCG